MDWKLILGVIGLIIVAILVFMFAIPPDMVFPVLFMGALGAAGFLAYKLYFEKREGTLLDPYKRGIQNKMRELSLARSPRKVPVVIEPTFDTNNPQTAGYAVAFGMAVIDKKKLKVHETRMSRRANGEPVEVSELKEEYRLENGDFMRMVELEPTGDSKVKGNCPLLFLDSQVHPHSKDANGDISVYGTLRIQGFLKTIGPDVLAVVRDPRSLGIYKAEVATMCLWESSIEQQKTQAIMADLSARGKPYLVEGKAMKERTTTVEAGGGGNA